MPVVLPPSVAHNWRQRVLVLPAWPMGFCPVHVFTDDRCGMECIEARVALAEAAHDLDVYWRWSHYQRRGA